MILKKLDLMYFRNIETVSFEPEKKINVFLGENGAGKSNILEAITCLSLAKSFRCSQDKNLINFNYPQFYLKGITENNNEEVTVEMGYDKTAKKTKVNGVSRTKLMDFVGTLKVVTFSPDDIDLIKEGPSERRKYLDIMLSQVSRTYGWAVVNYKKLLEQRNAVLKERKPHFRDVLEAYELQMSEYASIIWCMRNKAINQIKVSAPKFFETISNNNNTLDIQLNAKINLDFEENELLEVQEEYIAKMEEYREKDIATYTTNFGPHRDNVVITMNGLDSKTFASQGQQKLMALSLKIAEVLYIEETVEESPILLLDDVLSELDTSKIDNLLHFLNEGDRQSFITTAQPIQTEIPLKLWNVSSGEISEA